MLNNNLRHALPGLGWGTAAFLVYVAYDKLVAPKKEEHH
jgi:NADH-ubiquinone oxidoreductase B12 subunit family